MSGLCGSQNAFLWSSRPTRRPARCPTCPVPGRCSGRCTIVPQMIDVDRCENPSDYQIRPRSATSGRPQDQPKTAADRGGRAWLVGLITLRGAARFARHKVTPSLSPPLTYTSPSPSSVYFSSLFDCPPYSPLLHLATPRASRRLCYTSIASPCPVTQTSTARADVHCVRRSPLLLTTTPPPCLKAPAAVATTPVVATATATVAFAIPATIGVLESAPPHLSAR